MSWKVKKLKNSKSLEMPNVDLESFVLLILFLKILLLSIDSKVLFFLMLYVDCNSTFKLELVCVH